MHREQRFPCRVGHHQRCEHRRDLLVVAHQPHQQERDHRAEQVGAAVAQEHASQGEIPRQERRGGHGRAERDAGELRIAHRAGDVRDGEEAQQRVSRRQAVVAVDDVHRVRRAADHQRAEQQRGQRPLLQQRIERRQPEPQHLHLEHQPGRGGAAQRQQQAYRRADAARQVFAQAGEKRRHQAGQPERRAAFRQPQRPQQQPGGQREQHRQAAEARHPVRVEALHARRHVAGPGPGFGRADHQTGEHQTDDGGQKHCLHHAPPPFTGGIRNSDRGGRSWVSQAPPHAGAGAGRCAMPFSA